LRGKAETEVARGGGEAGRAAGTIPVLTPAARHDSL